jgi:hypothetical protein
MERSDPRLRLFLGLAISLGTMLSGEAKIGDTRAQMMSRHGIGKDLGEQMLFTSGAYQMTVFFSAADVVTMQVYAKPAEALLEPPPEALDGAPLVKPPERNRSSITVEEQEALLREHGEGQQWTPLKTSRGSQLWRRADGKVYAQYRAQDKSWLVMSSQGIGLMQ